MSEATPARIMGHGVVTGGVRHRRGPECRCGAPWDARFGDCARRVEWVAQLAAHGDDARVRAEVKAAKARYGE